MARIRGTKDNDSLFGTPEDDVIVGLGGADVLSGGLGNDKLDGGTGHDINLFGGPGTDRVEGGSGRDTFTFYVRNSHRDVILDFEDNRDTIRIITDRTLFDFDDLIIKQKGGNTIITFEPTGPAGGDIVLKNVGAGSLSAADFDFVAIP